MKNQDIDKIFKYYDKLWSNNSDKLINYSEEMKTAFARGICEGIYLCNNQQGLKDNLEKINELIK